MAMKIRCTDCEKKISIDNAFAGGVCRCPYCKAIVFVPGSTGAATAGTRTTTPAGGRPAAPPSRPITPASRPQAPGASRPSSPATSSGAFARSDVMRSGAGRPTAPVTPRAAEVTPTVAVPPAAEATPPAGKTAAIAQAQAKEVDIPMADPVRLQGIVSVILLGMIVVMIGGIVFAVVQMNKNAPKKADEATAQQQAAPVTPVVKLPKVQLPDTVADGMKVESPVIFCIDSTDEMGGTLPVFDGAEALVMLCVKTLSANAQYNVLLCGERDKDDAFFNAKGMETAGKDKPDKVKDFMDNCRPSGVSNLSHGFKKALDKKPKMIVLFTTKDGKDLGGLVTDAKTKGVKICTVALPHRGELNSDVKAGMEAIAQKTGGESRNFNSMDELKEATEAKIKK